MKIYIKTDGKHNEYKKALSKAGFAPQVGVDAPDFYLIGALVCLNDNEIEIEYNKRSSNTKTAVDLAVKHLNIEKAINKQGDQINLESIFEE